MKKMPAESIKAITTTVSAPRLEIAERRGARAGGLLEIALSDP